MKKKLVLLAFVSVLLSTTLSLCVVGLLELQIAYASPYTSITVATAYNMITNGSFPDLVVLDVRYQYEYDAGHIYGAVWIPYNELDGRIGELAGHENHEIIVYCASGGRSVTASGTLDSNNFTKVYNMQGGISAWQTAGYPVWNATVHNLNTTFNYDTIQAAIDAPQTLNGHTILVDAGTYYENVTIDKSISLIGENRSTTVIDGNGTGNVVYVTADNVNIRGFTIQNSGSSGIYAYHSNGNNITHNIITNNYYGIYLSESSSNSISENNITNSSSCAIQLYANSNNNLFYHNNFINNTDQVYSENCVNVWDDGYPSGGNYWSNQDHGPCADHYSGPDQNIAGSDGIVDDPYEIDEDNIDRYPLMEPWPCKITPQFPVGGIHVPVDKLSLLAPYIALVSTIIIAIAVTAFFSKYRKKQ